MDMAPLIAVGIIVIFNIVALILGRHSWRFLHIFAAFWVLAASVTVLVIGAMAVKTHLAWKKEHNEWADRLAAAAKEKQQVKYGDPASVDPNQSALATANARWWRVTYPLRPTRGCTVQNVGAGGITLNLPPRTPAPVAPPPAPDPTAPPDPGADPGGADPGGAAPPPAAEPVPNPIVTNDILYAYKEYADAKTGFTVPYVFLGEFKVTGTTDDSVTLMPVLPLAAAQRDAIQRADSTWVLYNVIPSDGHEWFRNLAHPLDHYFPQASYPMLSAEEYMRMIDSYRFDLMTLNEIKDQLKAEGRPEDAFKPDDRDVWTKVAFTQDIPRDDPRAIQVDSDVLLLTTDGEPYDPLGRAQKYELRQGVLEDEIRRTWDKNAKGTVGFVENQQGIFDKASAQALIDRGVAKIVDPVYVRPLTDYRFQFHDLYRQSEDLIDKQAQLEKDYAETSAAKDQVDQQHNTRQVEKDKLEQDESNYKLEFDKVSQHRAKLEQQWEQLKGEIRELYYQNKFYAAKIAEMQDAVEAEIERKVREAIAEKE